MTKVFVSYCHAQGEWVWDRLVPVLKAGGAEVLIDRERFEAGKAIFRQMDAVQDQAQRTAGHRIPQGVAGLAALAQRQWDDARAVLSKSRTPQVFRAGDPVDRSQEAFVERNEVIGEVEGQIMLATGCPGLILYGRRRVGKSTVLKNLPAFLPNRVRVATLSMQNAQTFTSLQSLLRLIAKTVQDACRDLELPAIEAAGLADLFPWLDHVNDRLDERGEDSRFDRRSLQFLHAKAKFSG